MHAQFSDRGCGGGVSQCIMDQIKRDCVNFVIKKMS